MTRHAYSLFATPQTGTENIKKRRGGKQSVTNKNAR
jgi:hypothetical protein